jgi:hypothetical protein
MPSTGCVERSQMTPQIAGPWVLVALGAIVIVAGVFILFRREARVALVMMSFVFGVLLCGLGVFGITFLDSYARFLKTSEILTAVMQAPSDQTYSQALDAVASGKVDPAQGQALLTYMEARPTPQFGDLVRRKAVSAKDPRSRALLAATADDFGRREESAAKLAAGLAAKNQLTPAAVESLDQGSQVLVARHLEANPNLYNVQPQTTDTCRS